MAVTPSDVEDIYDGTVIQEAVDAAQQIFDAVLEDCGYTQAQQDVIVTWLAAHFQAVIDDEGGVTMIQQGERQKRISDTFGENLRGSRYGQMAVSLDTCGKLANIGKQKATFDVL